MHGPFQRRRTQSGGSTCGLRRLALVSAVLAATLRPAGAARAASPDGLAIPADAPSLVSFEAASLGTYDPAYAAYHQLVPLLDQNGTPVAIATASGVVGSVYVDPADNVLVAYAWTSTSAQRALAVEILSGIDPALVPGYADAVGFLRTAQAIASARGIAGSRIYLTGFSLGGMLSSYVASQTGLPGVSFAASGLPGYRAPNVPAANFLNFVEAGDPVGQYATDAAERASAVAEIPHMDHYGTILWLGNGTAQAAMTGFAAELGGSAFASVLLEPPMLSQGIMSAYDGLVTSYHQMTLYSADANALASAFGFDPTRP